MRNIFTIRAKNKWRRSKMILFLERLELYVSSGLAINRALEISAQGVKESQQKEINEMRLFVESGQNLSKALLKYAGLSQTMAGLIEQGESCGNLARELDMARSLMEKEEELIKKCLSAITYPAVIGLFAFALTIGLVRGVMPQIIPMLKSLHVDLPFLTKIVIFISESITAYGIYIAFGIFTTVLLSLFTYKKFKKVRNFAHDFITIIPIIGNLFRNYSLMIFLRSCGSLIESGMHVRDAYTKSIVNIPLLSVRYCFSSKIMEVGKGMSLAKVFMQKGVPSYVPALLSAGESSGSLGKSMLRAANIMDREMEHLLKRLTSLIEPVMMAGMGAIVGAIAVSIMMPIYNISKVLQH